MSDSDPRSIARAHLESMSRKDAESMQRLFAPDVTFWGPAGTITGAADVLAGYRRLFPILARNQIRKILVEGDDACVIYDFVTDTPGGAVATVEWLRIVDGRIRSIWLLFDHKPWPKVLEELQRRTAR